MVFTCSNCSTVLTGKYCASCGQKRITKEERTLTYLLEEFFHYFSHLDGKYIKTLKNVLLNPGLVSRDIINGITARHFKISTFFLLGALIYFLIPQKIIGYGFLNTPLQPQLNSGLLRNWKEDLAQQKMAHYGISLQEYEIQYDHKLETNGKLLTLLLIPLTIPILFLVNLMIRLFKKEHSIRVFDLAIASLEVNSGFVYLIFLIVGLTITFFQRLMPQTQSQENLQTFGVILVILVTLVWLYRFFKKIYNLRWPVVTASVLLFVVGYSFVVVFYQLLSFIILY